MARKAIIIVALACLAFKANAADSPFLAAWKAQGAPLGAPQAWQSPPLPVQAFAGPAAADEPACPADPAAAAPGAVPEGCPCVPSRRPGAAAPGTCAAGFVCSRPWTAGAGGAAPFTCAACKLGQHCPPGSTLDPASPAVQAQLDALVCPSGSACPTPAQRLPCPPGSFCGAGTVAPAECAVPALLARSPALAVPAPPRTVWERVYVFGTPLGGNSCPANSTTPEKPCAPGFYCPSPDAALRCPKGSYCPEGSERPSPCPALCSCPPGSAKASLSYGGFLLLLGVLLGVWVSYAALAAAIALAQRRQVREHAAREALWRLLDPLLRAAAGGGGARAPPAFRAFKTIRPKLGLEFSNLGLTLPDGHRVLRDVSGSFRHSRVAAVMGPSGAGKSTLLSVLMGDAAGAVSGEVRVNGRPTRLAALRAVTGFVPQEDVVHEDLTVRENLVYSARLRLSSAKPLVEQLAIVDDVVDALQLRACQHQVVGTAERRGISGGQRKRVNIGWELVAKPSILFMDEPTSGLDSTAAGDILAALKRMAGLGMNIVAVIHQPRYSIFSMLDDVMLLGKGGVLVFQGPSPWALPYFSQRLGFEFPANENPADWAMDVVSGSVPRSGHPDFHPDDLVGLWSAGGAAWVAALPAAAAPAAVAAAPGAVDDAQLRLLGARFDAVDADGDGAIAVRELGALLAGLGLEAPPADVAAIAAQLADLSADMEPGTAGSSAAAGGRRITRAALLAYARAGGRPPTRDPAPPPPAGGPGARSARRRVATLYRVYSIEAGQEQQQYGVAEMLSELAAEAVVPAVRRAASRVVLSVGDDVRLGVAPDDEGDGGARQESVASLKLPPAPERAAEEGALPPAAAKGAPPAPPRRGGDALRDTPGVAAQFGVLLGRACVKWVRNFAGKFTDLLLLVFAGLICGFVHGSAQAEIKVRGNSALVFLALGMVAAVGALAVFGRDRLVARRERRAGVGTAPYFLASATVALADVLLQPLVFLAVYHSLTLPPTPLLKLYAVGVGVVWWASGLGGLVSVLAPPEAALVAAVVLVMVVGGFLNGVSPNFRDLPPLGRAATAASFNRWAVHASAVLNFAAREPARRPVARAVLTLAGACGLDGPTLNDGGGDAPLAPLAPAPGMEELDVGVYCAGAVRSALVWLFAEGLALRALTLAAMALFPRGLTLEPVVGFVSARRWRRRRGAA